MISLSISLVFSGHLVPVYPCPYFELTFGLRRSNVVRHLPDLSFSKYLRLFRRFPGARGSAARLPNYRILISSRTHASHPLLPKLAIASVGETPNLSLKLQPPWCRQSLQGRKEGVCKGGSALDRRSASRTQHHNISGHSLNRASSSQKRTTSSSFPVNPN